MGKEKVMQFLTTQGKKVQQIINREMKVMKTRQQVKTNRIQERRKARNATYLLYRYKTLSCKMSAFRGHNLNI